jgi:hypothetical protein
MDELCALGGRTGFLTIAWHDCISFGSLETDIRDRLLRVNQRQLSGGHDAAL